jgi:hypothetical protein
MPEFTERFFIPAPVPTSETKKDADDNLLTVYLDQQGEPLLWSGDFPLPAIDTRVFVKQTWKREHRFGPILTSEYH